MIFFVPLGLIALFVLCGGGLLVTLLDFISPVVWVIAGLVVVIAIVIGIVGYINENRK